MFKLKGVAVLLFLTNYVLSIAIPKVHEVSAKEPLPLTGVDGRDTLILKCDAGGNPFPTLHWTFEGKKIVRNDQFMTRKSGAELYIYEVKKSNSGKYRCIATNTYGSVFGEINFEVPAIGKFNEGFKVGEATKSITATIGKPLTIKCPPHSEGAGEIYYWGDLPSGFTPIIWYPGNPVKRAFIGSHGDLSFSYLKQEDITRIHNLGGISCIIYRDKVSVQGVRFKIKADGPGVNTTFPAKLVAFMDKEFVEVEGRQKTIVCGATGRPHPMITWYKDGMKIYDPYTKELKGGQNIKVQGESMELIIKPVTKSSAGKYKCVAKNSVEDSREGTLTVHSRAKWVDELPEEVKVPYAYAIKLRCKASGFPKVVYTWYHNNTLINATDELKIVEGNLTIAVSDFHHSGIYMCVASNYLNTIVSPGYVEVEAIPPTFKTLLENPTYFFKRHTNTLPCDATAGPSPMKTWFRNDKLIEPKGRYFIKENGTLSLVDTVEPDAGQFKCVATNVKGSAETSAIVKVVEKTVITKPPANLSHKEGLLLTQLFCKAVYEEKLKVTFKWLKDGKPLLSTDRIYNEMRISGPSQIVTIKNLKLEDAGTYTCHVYTTDERLVSEDKAGGSITVIAKPKAPIKLTLAGNCGTTGNDMLSWEAPEMYGPPVDHYIVEYSASDSKWFPYNSGDKIGDTEVKLSNKFLPPSANLVFRVKAVSVHDNDELISKPSEATKAGSCSTPVGAPTMNPGNVKSQVEGDGKLTIVWDQLDSVHKPGPDFEIVVGYRKVGSDKFINQTVPGDRNSFVVPNPGSKEQYEVFVQSKNKYGLGPATMTTTVYSGEKPITSVVQNVKVTAISSTGVTLSWGALGAVTKYQINYWIFGTSRRKRESPERPYIEVEGVTNYNLTRLSPNSDYRLTISGLNVNGAGPESAEVSFKTMLGVPAAPTNVKLDVLGGGLKLSWDPPAVENSPVSSYTIVWYQTGVPNAKVKSMTMNATAKEAYITSDLDALTYYTVELRANSDSGEGKSWKIDGVVVGNKDKPGQPATPKVVAVNGSRLNVTFVLADNYFGGVPTQFKVYYTKDGQSQPQIELQDFPKQSWLLLTNLEPAIYTIWTAGMNSMGESSPSNKTQGTPKKRTIVVPANQPASKPFYAKIWFIILIVLIVLLIIVLILIYVCCNKRGGRYLVGEKEKDRGGWSDNQPLKDYSEIPMDEVEQSPLPTKSNGAPVRSVSQNSLSKKPPENEEDDADSLDDYGEDTKFNEDGSFIGQYGDEDKKPTKV